MELGTRLLLRRIFLILFPIELANEQTKLDFKVPILKLLVLLFWEIFNSFISESPWNVTVFVYFSLLEKFYGSIVTKYITYKSNNKLNVFNTEKTILHTKTKRENMGSVKIFLPEADYF